VGSKWRYASDKPIAPKVDSLTWIYTTGQNNKYIGIVFLICDIARLFSNTALPIDNILKGYSVAKHLNKKRKRGTQFI